LSGIEGWGKRKEILLNFEQKRIIFYVFKEGSLAEIDEASLLKNYHQIKLFEFC